MGKQETVDKYKEQFLEGRSEEARARFLSKDIDKQYISIMGWRRRNKMKKEKDTPSASNIILELRSVRKNIVNVDLTPKDAERILREIDALKGSVENYEKLVAEKELHRLEADRRKMSEMIEALREKINS